MIISSNISVSIIIWKFEVVKVFIDWVPLFIKGMHDNETTRNGKYYYADS